MKHIEDISISELHAIGGGDWFETTWGTVLGAGFAAGLVGSGGFLAVGAIAGISLYLF